MVRQAAPVGKAIARSENPFPNATPGVCSSIFMLATGGIRMELRALLAILRKRWQLIAVTLVVVFGVSAGVTLTATPQYQATTRLFVTVSSDSANDLGQLVEGSGYIENQLTSYAQVATSSPVLAPVIDQLDLDTTPDALAASITAEVPEGTQFIDITVQSENRTSAAQIADAVGDQLVEVVGELGPTSSSVVTAKVFEPAVVPTEPFSPDVPRNLALGLATGLMLGILVAFLRESLDTKLHSEADVAKVTSTSVVGTIGVRNPSRQSTGNLFVHEEPLSAAAEGMRRLRTNLQYVGLAEGARAVVVTSPMPGDGKSSIAANLALTLVDSGLRTLLVDADLRRPSVAEYLDLEDHVGLTAVLIGRASLADVVQEWGPSGLSVLVAGDLPPNPSELLGSRAMVDLLAQMTQQYDFVVFDTPPVQPVTDAVALAKGVDGVLMVVDSRRTRQADLRKSLDAFKRVHAHVLGIVLNKVNRAADRDAYRSYYSEGAVLDRGLPPRHVDAHEAVATDPDAFASPRDARWHT